MAQQTDVMRGSAQAQQSLSVTHNTSTLAATPVDAPAITGD